MKDQPVVTKPVVEVTPEASSDDRPTSFSDIHATLLADEKSEKVEAKAVASDIPDTTQAEPAPQGSTEVKATEQPAAKPSTDEGEDDQKAEPEEKPIPKHEREKYRLRKQRDAEKERADALETKLKDAGLMEGSIKDFSAYRQRLETKLKDAGLMEEWAEPAAVDPMVQAEFKVKTALSRKNFIKTYGEDKLKELVGEDSTWVEIEERAKSGDRGAIRLHQQALDADDPFEEIQTIVEDEKLFEEYGTRSVSTILAKAKEEQTTALEKRLQAEHVIRHPKPGKPAPTLSSVTGQSPEGQKADEAATPFSIREFYGVS